MLSYVIWYVRIVTIKVCSHAMEVINIYLWPGGGLPRVGDQQGFSHAGVKQIGTPCGEGYAIVWCVDDKGVIHVTSCCQLS